MNRTTGDHITTAEELWEAGDIGRCELVRGRLLMMTPASGEHGRVTMELAWRLASHVRQNDLGAVYAAETGFLIETNPDTVRAPDCAFIARDRVPTRGQRGFVTVVPDLAVETVSPAETSSDVFDKVQQWLSGGCRLVWVIDPQTKSTTVYTPDGQREVLQAGDVLTGGEVLSGFELRVGDLFEP